MILEWLKRYLHPDAKPLSLVCEFVEGPLDGKIEKDLPRYMAELGICQRWTQPGRVVLYSFAPIDDKTGKVKALFDGYMVLEREPK